MEKTMKKSIMEKTAIGNILGNSTGKAAGCPIFFLLSSQNSQTVLVNSMNSLRL